MRSPRDEGTGPLTRRGWWILFCGWWTVLAFLFVGQHYGGRLLRGREPDLTEALLVGFIDSFSWAAVALVAFWLARRFPFERRRIGRFVAIHLPFAVVLVTGRLHTFNLLDPLLFPGVTRSFGGMTRIVVAFPTNLLAYSLILGAGVGIVYFRRSQESALTAARLETQLANAQVTLLTTQLQPRFLFGTLRSISSLMHRDVRAADRLLALVGDLLRATLRQSDETEISLDDELMMMELYLEIEHARLGESFEVSWDIQPEVREARVPRMVLQPLLAHAVRRQAGEASPSRISVAGHRRDDDLLLEVRFRSADEADQFDADDEAELNSLRLRLHQMYPGRATGLDVLRRDGQCVMRLRLPIDAVVGGADDEALEAIPAAVGGVR